MNHGLMHSCSLSLKSVSFTWPSGEKVIDKCSFSIPKPGLWMIVGTNGSGKSTLFRLITGILQPQEGQIYSSLKASLMFQNPDHQLLLPSCGSDLLLSLPRNLTMKERNFRIKEAMQQVDLAGMESRPIHTLSGGQKQRLALAGALVSEAKLLLLDEPTALLDPRSQKSILKTLQRLTSRKESPITALWITHRLDELSYCDGAVEMNAGRIGAWQSGDSLRQRLLSLARRRV